MESIKKEVDQQVVKKLSVKIGSRKSQLALIQTNLVIKRLKEYYENNPGRFHELYGREEFRNMEPEYQVVAMTTTGDMVQDKPLPSIGTKSLFTRELEVALLDGRVDFVVHSLKDLPTTLPEGCVIGAVLKRDDPNDVIVLKKSLHSHPNPMDIFTETVKDEKIKIGTSSHRRIAMVKRLNTKLECIDIRGNLNTRLKKLDDDVESYTAIVLAKAGLDRMNWSHRASVLLSPQTHYALKDWCYAVGQGAIAVECRSNDEAILNILSPVVDLQTTYETAAERCLMKKLEGGCSVPLGVRSSWIFGDQVLLLDGIVLSLDGNNVVRARSEAHIGEETSRELKHHTSLPLEELTTGYKISKTFDTSKRIEEKLIDCAKLGVNVANKMISQGCLELMRQQR